MKSYFIKSNTLVRPKLNYLIVSLLYVYIVSTFFLIMIFFSLLLIADVVNVHMYALFSQIPQYKVTHNCAKQKCFQIAPKYKLSCDGNIDLLFLVGRRVAVLQMVQLLSKVCIQSLTWDLIVTCHYILCPRFRINIDLVFSVMDGVLQIPTPFVFNVIFIFKPFSSLSTIQLFEPLIEKVYHISVD